MPEASVQQQLASVLAAALEYSTSLRSLMAYLQEPDDRCSCAEGQKAHPGDGDEEPDSSFQGPFHERWKTYRTKRSVLGEALNYHQVLLGSGQPDVTTKIATDMEKIDLSLHLNLGQDDGRDIDVEKLIDKLARASYRVDQSRKVKALVPPVFNVDLESAEAISAAGKRGPVPNQGSVESILAGLPWLYQVSLVSWMLTCLLPRGPNLR